MSFIPINVFHLIAKAYYDNEDITDITVAQNKIVRTSIFFSQES
jgi:hypothetical protein